MIAFIKKIIRCCILKVKWGNKVKFSFNATIGLKSNFEGMNQIHAHTEFNGVLGYGSYIGPNACINGRIGRFSSIAPYVRSNSGAHPYTYPYATTAPCFFSLNQNKVQNGSTFATDQKFDEVVYADENNRFPIIIGNDCWIGQGAFIVGGVTIKDGAVILAHAVVTKSVPPYAIVGGVPARIIGYRYSQEDIQFLLKIKWWNNSVQWFKDNWQLLTNFEELKKYYENR